MRGWGCPWGTLEIPVLCALLGATCAGPGRIGQLTHRPPSPLGPHPPQEGVREALALPGLTPPAEMALSIR